MLGEPASFLGSMRSQLIKCDSFRETCFLVPDKDPREPESRLGTLVSIPLYLAVQTAVLHESHVHPMWSALRKLLARSKIFWWAVHRLARSPGHSIPAAYMYKGASICSAWCVGILPDCRAMGWSWGLDLQFLGCTYTAVMWHVIPDGISPSSLIAPVNTNSTIRSFR